MIFGLFALALVILILFMMTLGAVLLAGLLIGGTSSARRIALAAIGAPLVLLLPVFAVTLSETGARTGTEMGAGFVILLGVFGVIAWPVAHFATRRLDRLTQFDPSVFE